jgi:hypothetical protein
MLSGLPHIESRFGHADLSGKHPARNAQLVPLAPQRRKQGSDEVDVPFPDRRNGIKVRSQPVGTTVILM